MADTIFLIVAGVVTLGVGPFMLLYWIPKWEKVGIQKALDRESRERGAQ